MATTSSRRRALAAGWAGALGAAAAVTRAPELALAADKVEVESVLLLSTLEAGLATAPVRRVVVTGANSGVGLNGASRLVAAGHQVTLLCRTQAKADGAAAACQQFADAQQAAGSAAFREGGSVVGVVCDLADLASVRACAASLQNQPIDTLCCNAGLAMNTADKAAKRTAQGFELTVGTNHLGHFLLANLLKGALAKSPNGAGRLVVTGSPVHDPKSGGGDVGSTASLGDLAGLAQAAAAPNGGSFDMVDGGPYDPDKAYKDSKLCNLLFTAEAAKRWAASGIQVDAFSPGLIPSPDGFFRNQNPAFAKTFSAIAGLAGVSETNAFGGAALAFLAVAPALPRATGGWYDSYPPGKHQLAVHPPSVEAQNVDEQAQLWALSAKLTGLAA